MDPVATAFQPASDEVLELIHANPLAWVVSASLTPLLMPIRPIVDAGRLTGFHGHLPRSSPLSSDLAEQPRALLLFTGTQGYLSPSWLSNRKQAPTWASASAAFECRIALDEDPAALRDSLADLVSGMEADRPKRWALDELGERYEQLAKRIVAFRADIVAQRAAFRLGQTEDEQSFGETLLGLRGEGRDELAALMQRFRR